MNTMKPMVALAALIVFGYTNLNLCHAQGVTTSPTGGQELTDAEREALGLAPESPAAVPATPPLTEAAEDLPPIPEDSSDDSNVAPVTAEPPPFPVEPKTADTTPAPTDSPESYERYRETRLAERARADWTTSLFFSPRAFTDADWRVRPYSGQVKNPKFFGVILQGERILFRKAGLVALGAEFGAFGNTAKDRFNDLFPAVGTLGVFASYNAQFSTRQIVVPFVKGGVEGVRYAYEFAEDRVSGIRAMPRADAGLHIFLNFLDQSSAGEAYGNFGILRSYLTAAYSISRDTSKKDVDLSDSAFRLGFRLEY